MRAGVGVELVGHDRTPLKPGEVHVGVLLLLAADGRVQPGRVGPGVDVAEADRRARLLHAVHRPAHDREGLRVAGGHDDPEVLIVRGGQALRVPLARHTQQARKGVRMAKHQLAEHHAAHGLPGAVQARPVHRIGVEEEAHQLQRRLGLPGHGEVVVGAFALILRGDHKAGAAVVIGLDGPDRRARALQKRRGDVVGAGAQVVHEQHDGILLAGHHVLRDVEVVAELMAVPRGEGGGGEFGGDPQVHGGRGPGGERRYGSAAGGGDVLLLRHAEHGMAHGQLFAMAAALAQAKGLRITLQQQLHEAPRPDQLTPGGIRHAEARDGEALHVKHLRLEVSADHGVAVLDGHSGHALAVAVGGGHHRHAQDGGCFALHTHRRRSFLAVGLKAVEFRGPAAGNEVVGHQLGQLLRLMAGLAGIRTARGEAAARPGIDRRGDLALEVDALVRMVNVRGGNRGEQRLRVGMQRADEQLLRGGGFHQLAQIHDADVVRDVAHDREVMGDEHVGQPLLLLQILEQVEHLRLNGDVQGGDRLIADDELRVQGQGARDAHALAAAAVQLMRIGVAQALVDANQVHEVLGLLVDLGAGLVALAQRQRLADDLLDRLARVQRGIRVLEDDLHLLVV